MHNNTPHWNRRSVEVNQIQHGAPKKNHSPGRGWDTTNFHYVVVIDTLAQRNGSNWCTVLHERATSLTCNL
jgi:hypothetical protein